jgi:hypothetical protein
MAKDSLLDRNLAGIFDERVWGGGVGFSVQRSLGEVLFRQEQSDKAADAHKRGSG